MTTKSAISLKSAVISLKSLSLSMKKGQVQLPKFTTNGLLFLAKSNKFERNWPLADTTQGFGASAPSFAFFCRSVIKAAVTALYISHPNKLLPYTSWLISHPANLMNSLTTSFRNTTVQNRNRRIPNAIRRAKDAV